MSHAGLGGRGLKRGFPDLIPLERVDIIEDLKRVVDVHRLTDFSLHDRVVPTIELRRTEDELIIAAAVGVGALAANFSFVQLFNSTVDKILRPVAMHVQSGGTECDLFFDTVQIGVGQVGQAVDRRKAAGPFAINAGSVGRFSPNQAVAVPGAIFWDQAYPAGSGVLVSPELLRTMALPPGTGLNVAANVVNVGITIAMAYRVDFLASTRPAGI